MSNDIKDTKMDAPVSLGGNNSNPNGIISKASAAAAAVAVDTTLQSASKMAQQKNNSNLSNSLR